MWERHKITYKNGKSIRLDGDEYLVNNLDLSKYQSQDIVEANIEQGKLVEIRFPPGMEPAQPSKDEVAKQFVEEAKTAKVLQWQIVKIEFNHVVLTKGEQSAKFNTVDNAAKYYKSFKPGDLVQFAKVDENGVRPPKKEYTNGAAGNVEKAAWIQVLGNISIAAEQYEWSEEKTASAVNRAIRLYNAFGTSLDKEVKN